uniref:LAM_G_DOMAIN domain-containing protein n=1 Tax=Haemonchus placei TaxID=6290 RepID=A0A0N4VVY5_HAEPC
LKCVSTFTAYNFEKSKWEERILPTEPRDYFGQKGFVLGLSSDSTYLVVMQTGPRKSTAVIYFLLLSPKLAIHKNHIIIRDYTPLTGLRVYFHPCSRFVCAFVYNE